MKNQLMKMLCIIMAFSVWSTIFAQEEITKEFFNKNIGEGIKLVKAICHLKNGSENEYACKSFVVEVEESGAYYISAFLTGEKGSKYDVIIDDQVVLEVVSLKDDWQTCLISDKRNGKHSSIYLLHGKHIITFEGKNNVAPSISDINICKNIGNAGFKKEIFLSWVKELKSSEVTEQKTQNNSYEQELVESKSAQSMLAAQNAYYQFTGFTGAMVTYTSFLNVYLTLNVTYTFETRDPIPSGTDPVMYLYSETPGTTLTRTWSNDNGAGGNMSKKVVTIPYSGWYILMVRAKSYLKKGTVDIYQNGTRISDNAIVAGNSYYGNPATTTGTSTKNFFIGVNNGGDTYDPSNDSYLCIATTPIAPFRKYCDDYYASGGGDYDWGRLPRIKETSASTIYYAMASLYNTDQGETFQDIYMHVGGLSSTVLSKFPNLKNDDAMTSSSSYTGNYNSVAWAGGLTSSNQYPWQSTNFYYWPGDVIGSLAGYFFNRNGYTGVWKDRYPGAQYYFIRDFGHPYITLDVYNYNNLPSTISIRHNINNGYLHGYDCEVKYGNSVRIFHPRFAIEGGVGVGQLESYGFGDPE